MNGMIPWIAAEAERPGGLEKLAPPRREWQDEVPVEDLPAHRFPGRQGAGAHDSQDNRLSESPGAADYLTDECEEDRQRRIYRARTVTMLRRYMRYSIETGRLPSLLGREFFRSKVTSYTVVTFEDRVIFVHDMENCLNRLDEFSRQVLGRHILQEHDQAETARLLQCAERTIRTYVPMALDLLSDILIEVGLLERVVPIREKPCQGGPESHFSVSDCKDGKNKS
jgi:hypothetical protein